MALAATVAAALWPQDDVQHYQPPQTAVKAASLAAVTPAGMPPAGAEAADVLAQEDGAEEGRDPFAPRNWQPPAPPAPVAVKTVVAAQPVATITLPEGPPPVPFQFAGRMNDGEDQVVYLARGENALVARTGEVLENVYKVVSIDASQIEFLHLPTGQKQVLPLPARDN